MRQSTFYRYSAYILRFMARLFLQWPLLLLADYFFVPIAVPHLRMVGHFDNAGRRIRHDYIYLGSRGLIRYQDVIAQGCPLLRMINPRNHP